MTRLTFTERNLEDINKAAAAWELNVRTNTDAPEYEQVRQEWLYCSQIIAHTLIYKLKESQGNPERDQ